MRTDLELPMPVYSRKHFKVVRELKDKNAPVNNTYCSFKRFIIIPGHCSGSEKVGWGGEERERRVWLRKIVLVLSSTVVHAL